VALRLLTEAYRTDALDDLLASVKGDERNRRLIDYVRQWNTNSRLAEVSSAVQVKLLMAAAATADEEEGSKKLNSLKLDGLRAFDKKHYDRVSALSARLAIVDALLQTE